MLDILVKVLKSRRAIDIFRTHFLSSCQHFSLSLRNLELQCEIAYDSWVLRMLPFSCLSLFLSLSFIGSCYLAQAGLELWILPLFGIMVIYVCSQLLSSLSLLCIMYALNTCAGMLTHVHPNRSHRMLEILAQFMHLFMSHGLSLT